MRAFFVPTPSELAEWAADPSALMAHGEPAASPGASGAGGGVAGGGAASGSARPCAESLLLCLLLRDRQGVTQSILRIAADAQAATAAAEAATAAAAASGVASSPSSVPLLNCWPPSPPSPAPPPPLFPPPGSPAAAACAEASLLTDGAYRALGCVCGELPPGAVRFPHWFATELRPRLAAHAAAAEAGERGDAGGAAIAASLPHRLLAARSLWLISKFADEATGPGGFVFGGDGGAASPPSPQAASHTFSDDAASVVLPLLSPRDPLLALHAAAALKALWCAHVCRAHAPPLARAAALRHHVGEKYSPGTPPHGGALSPGLVAPPSPPVVAQSFAPSWALAALTRCLSLLTGLGEPETTVGVCRLCGDLVAGLGREALAPHAATLAAALPSAWRAAEAAAGGEAGGAVRAQCALLALVTTLVTHVGTSAPLAGEQQQPGATSQQQQQSPGPATPAHSPFLPPSPVTPPPDSPGVGGCAPNGSPSDDDLPTGLGAVVWPLLSHALGCEALCDDGAALWLATLRASTRLTRPMAALAPRLFALLAHDPTPALLCALQARPCVGKSLYYICIPPLTFPFQP